MISIIVAIFNPEWNKLRATLISILRQKDIEFEIVIADDGSKQNCQNMILSLFNEFEFTNYQFSILRENRGTCWNIYTAINLAKYDYIKTISPGDMLYSDKVLSEWFEYTKKHNADLSFGNAIYYEGQTLNVINGVRNPLFIDIYKNKTRIDRRISYLLIPDAVLGASVLFRKKLGLEYIGMIVDHVKYCEDYFIKLYLINRGKILYYDNFVIWYEHGLGVSTNKKWEKLVAQDKSECARIMYKMPNQDWRWRYIWKCQINTGNLPHTRMILFPSIIPYILKKKIFKCQIKAEGYKDSYVVQNLIGYFKEEDN